MDKKDKTICPHCGKKMSKWMPPPESSWGPNYQYVCFNDECSYYQRGWKHMMENFQQKASYRYRYNPHNDESGPLPVWSESAMKNAIIKE